MMRTSILILSLLVCPFAAHAQNAQENQAKNDNGNDAAYKKLEETLSGATMKGRFTIEGKEDKSPKPEEYNIISAKKVGEGDLWVITARIKYGDHDVTLPVPVAIKWAGNTPMITLDKVMLPGLGTFDARVMIHDNKYAGTWRHDKVSGHLFGTIAKKE